MTAALLACDWGTTNLRAWTLDVAGAVVESRDFELGVSRLPPGEAARRFAEEVRPALSAQDLPAILCGMIGSNLGWTVAPYVHCPADLASLGKAMTAVEPRTRIVPGLIGPGLTAAPDVMRGEETQVFGWVAQDPQRAHGRHVVCHPGTHPKWVLVEEGAIVRFITAMTGELFAMLRQHSVLKHDAVVEDETAFDAGLAAAADGGALAARLFSARSRVVGAGAAAEETPSYLSGLLIGAEVAGLRTSLDAGDASISLLGDPGLCRWYARAFDRLGLQASRHDGEAAAISGLFALAHMGGLL
jgi:2-dehydro-3-deoxygalactonokinase